MNRLAAASLGALTALPIICFVYSLYWLVTNFLSGDVSLHYAVDRLIALNIGMMVLILFLLAFYVPYLFRTDRIPEVKRPPWAAALVLLNVVSMPVFWYHYVWKEK